jgi:hypothetical protein
VIHARVYWSLAPPPVKAYRGPVQGITLGKWLATSATVA